MTPVPARPADSAHPRRPVDPADPAGLPAAAGRPGRARRAPSSSGGFPHGLSRRGVLLLTAVVGLAGCGSLGGIRGTELTSEVARTELSLTDASDLRAAVTACDALGAALLAAQLDNDAHANALASPVSLTLSLATASLGATDPDAQGLNTLLGADSEKERNTTWSAIRSSLLAHDTDDGDVSGFDPGDEAPEEPLVHVADQLLVVDHDEPTEVSQEFVDEVHRWFTTDLRRAEADDAQDVLDQWVRQNTAGLIESSALEVTENLRAALQNVVLFAARWRELFDEKETRDEEFTCADGSVTSVPMMRQTTTMTCTEGKTGGRTEGKDEPVTWKVLRVPYSQDFALDVVLPQKGTLPGDLPTETWSQASALLDEAEEEGLRPEVSLVMPRIDLETGDSGVDIMPVLEGLGADIVPMGRIGPGLEVNAYRQQVRLIVREDGTVAAGASEVDVGVSATDLGQATEFRVDRPYAMRLRDLTTGLALFEAVINNPKPS
ncbi:serpin family protein [Actinomyces wuliandei]|uniref:serpin family protein n=1 Tax=Actinomyces wuliandei TaxID=2057743 RepID=UPI00111A96D4|nr:serpin family protein [Actinomyces wuliandei]